MIIGGWFLIAVLAGAVAAHGEEGDRSAKIKALEAQIALLRQQLASLQATAPAAAVTTFSKTLRRGSAGPEVERLQEFLSKTLEFYPEGLVTGYFGSRTEAAVRRFQKTYGIPALGLIGPQTRAKLNELLLASAAPVPAPPPPTPAPTPPPPPPPTPPVPVQAPPPPPTPPSPAPTPPSVPLPSPADLGRPLFSAVGWGPDYLKISFTHAPTSVTRSYAIYIRKPGATGDTRFGPYVPPSVGSQTASGTEALRRAGPSSWEWTNTLNLAVEPEGDYQLWITAVGDGGVESDRSPGRIATLHRLATFSTLLEDSPARAVQGNTVRRFPLTLRLENPYASLYYHYRILDNAIQAWDSAYLRQSTSDKIEAVFTNANGYLFTAGNTYRIVVDSFDNNTGSDSEVKQKSAELVFTYQP